MLFNNPKFQLELARHIIYFITGINISNHQDWPNYKVEIKKSSVVNQGNSFIDMNNGVIKQVVIEPSDEKVFVNEEMFHNFNIY